ncbi:ATP-binding protein [Streptomyces sp. CC208A]|uniref:ATP-binding protein n=1 Tax=Streptomyces sp. CC208A TaxID=3044573 RepID=UPI0024A7D521|nr:ATP-binding protein [Streptomyces sp. CC208A]
MNQETSQLVASERHFTIQLSSTHRGARLARLLAVEQLRFWGLGGVVDPATQVVAELVNNAVTHGHVDGRDFRLGMTLGDTTLLVEATDTRGDRLPLIAARSGEEEGGRGLLIVAGLALRWGVRRGPVPQKTVWAELALS